MLHLPGARRRPPGGPGAPGHRVPWGYAPLFHKSHREPFDELRHELADLIRFLAARGRWDATACLAICDDEEAFRARWRALYSTPLTRWLEDLRLTLAVLGLPSTIPPADPDDPLGLALRERIRPGLSPLLDPPLPPAGELTEAMERDAAAAPALGYVSKLLRIVGAGAKLSAKGNLGLAHGRAFADAIGCAELFDERFGDKVFKTRSTSEIEPVDLTLRWALAAGLLRRQHGKVIVTQRGRRLEHGPMEGWWALLRAAGLKLNWPRGRYPKDRLPFWADLVCACIPGYLRCAHDAGGRGLATLPLAEATWELVERRWVTDGLSDEKVGWEVSHVESSIRGGLFLPLRLLGCAETWEGAADGAARMTPLGIWAIRRLAEEEREGRAGAPPGVVVLDEWRRDGGR